MEVTIRKAKKEDCPQMMKLIQELADYEKAPNEVTVSMQEFEQSGFGKEAVWQAFVAESSGNLVGLALFYIRYSTWKGRRLYLEDLIVTKSFRGKGVGKQLFDKVLKFSKEKNYCGMVFQVLDWNTPAIEFYKKYNANFDSQ